MHRRPFNLHTGSEVLVGGCLFVLGSIVFGCSSASAPEPVTGGNTSSVPRDEGGAGGSGTSATGGSASASTGGGTGSGIGGLTAGSNGNGGSSASGGGSAAASTGGGETGNLGTATTGVSGGVTGATTGAGGRGTVGGNTSAGATGGAPEGGLSEAGGAPRDAGDANADASNTSNGRSAGCGKAPGIASNQYNNGQTISITVGGVQRRYVLNVPTNYDNSHPYKLVMTLHQRDGNDKQMYNWQYYGLLSPSNNTAIFAAPNGQKNGAPCTGTGDGDSGCGWPNPNGQDLALVDAVVAQVEQNFCVDTNHIFATGWSYGGSMSYDVGCERPLGKAGNAWGVRAIAVYSGAQLSGNCTPSMPVGYYASHGTHDSVLNYDQSGLPLAQNFAKANGCTWATPTKVTSGAHVCTNLMGCKTGYPLEFCSFNGDHTPFPDTGQAAGSWGPQEAWKFLSQF